MNFSLSANMSGFCSDSHIYPMRYMRKTTDMLRRVKFWLSQTYRFKPKLKLHVK